MAFSLLSLLMLPNISLVASSDFQGNPHLSPTAAQSQLVIYTYESLLNDPSYDYVGAYANFSGIPKEEIQIIALEDANTIVTRAALEKDDPVADVVIGVDNVLIHTAKAESILEPYVSPALANISADLITNLDPDHYVTPYDYGIIALFYDSHRINSTTVPELHNLTLDDIISLGLAEQLIVQDPTLSSTGLGFLLWTIAVFGDPTLEFEGLLGQDWRGWWGAAKDDLRIAPSWGSAFSEWYDADQKRPIMVSYGTSPAYSAVLYDDDSQGALLSHELNQTNAWLQIEGIGLVKNAPHPEAAKAFIDWFLSTELQDQIAEHNWMYPANIHAEVSQTFQDASINPDDVDILNDLITPNFLGDNLNMWKDDWEAAIATSIPGYPLSILLSFLLLGLVHVVRKTSLRKIQ
ncbi:MAG: thiamine ABC transporter substrate-binding protein [Promethearchaeota archaeon]